MKLMHVTIAMLLVATPAAAQSLAEASAKAKADRAAKCAATQEKCQTRQTPIPARHHRQ
jgi:hypothetical protein